MDHRNITKEQEFFIREEVPQYEGKNANVDLSLQKGEQ